MIQQGQVFKLTAKGADGEPLWVYRYRLEGRSSARPQVGGFASRAEAQKALRKALDRVGPGRGGAITLAELVDEYLELHQAEPVTIAKLRWLLGKATGALGEKRIADVSPKDVYAWRLTVPDPPPQGPRVERNLLVKRARMQGFLIFDHVQRSPEALRELESWVRNGQIRYREDILDGIEQAPGSIAGLYRGENLGKRLIRIAPDALPGDPFPTQT